MNYESLKNKYVYTTDDVEDLFWSANHSKSELLSNYCKSFLLDLKPLSLYPIYGIGFYSTMTGMLVVLCHEDKSYLERITKDVINDFYNKLEDETEDVFDALCSKYDLKVFCDEDDDFNEIECLIVDRPLAKIINSLSSNKLPDYYDLKYLGTVKEIPVIDYGDKSYFVQIIDKIEERF